MSLKPTIIYIVYHAIISNIFYSLKKIFIAVIYSI